MDGQRHVNYLLTRRYFEDDRGSMLKVICTDVDVGYLQLPSGERFLTVTGLDGQPAVDPDWHRYPFTGRLARTALIHCLEAAGEQAPPGTTLLRLAGK